LSFRHFNGWNLAPKQIIIAMFVLEIKYRAYSESPFGSRASLASHWPLPLLTSHSRVAAELQIPSFRAMYYLPFVCYLTVSAVLWHCLLSPDVLAVKIKLLKAVKENEIKFLWLYSISCASTKHWDFILMQHVWCVSQNKGSNFSENNSDVFNFNNLLKIDRFNMFAERSCLTQYINSSFDKHHTWRQNRKMRSTIGGLVMQRTGLLCRHKF